MLSRKWGFIGIGAALVGAVAAALLYGAGRSSDAAFISPANRALVARGKVIYANHCAACHGAALQGQPNWRERLANGRLPAPPHDKTGHTWHHPDAVLIDIVTNGLVPGRTAPAGYASDMPAFGGTLSREEIVAVLTYIKSSWPPEILRLQKEVTLEHL
ncbi:MAG: cytochrome c [Burkholderiaceae bacterium]|nr:MAG: cytochrome c [Burkholderiaceae bacterium]